MASIDSPPFLFSSLGSKPPTTARKQHIRRLYDILQLCILRQDYLRAKRAWSILVRCKEIDWRAMWRMGTLLLGQMPEHGDESNAERLSFLSAMMLQNPEAKELILQELVLRMIMSGQLRQALDELELYLPSPPYEDNPVLHIYAGLICLYLAQPSEDAQIADELFGGRESEWITSSLRDGQLYLEKAKSLDPENVVASAWLEKIPTLIQQSANRQTPDSDEESMVIDDDRGPRTRYKRAKR